MPKIVDHDERRIKLLHATWRVIGRVGLEGTTVRAIAKEAGYSNGVLAHYFANKDDIIIQAHRLAYQAVYDRARASSDGLNGMAALREAINEALPLDDARMLEAVVDISLQGQALHSDVLRAARRESQVSSDAWWAGMVTDAMDRGEIDRGLDVDFVVAQIRIFVAGASAEAVMSPDLVTPQVQARAAEAFLDTLRPGS